MMTQPALTFQNGTKREYNSNRPIFREKATMPWSESSKAVIFVTAQLLQAILSVLQLDEDAILSSHTVPWSSATFDGMRYTWSIATVESSARKRAERFCKLSAEHDWPLKGAFVADLSGRLDGNCVIVDVLTVMER